VTSERPERATLADVARRAGVSVSTASNALTGVRPVGDDARRRVLAAAAALAYEPDRVARSLVSRRSDTIGILVPDVTNPFFADLGRHLTRALAERGFAALIGDSDNDIDRQRLHLRAFESRRVDAVIVVPAVFEDDGLLAEVARRRPTILLDRTVRGWAGSSVGVRQAAGVEAVVDHLAGLGHRRFGYVSGSRATSTGRTRLESFTGALEARALPPPLVVEGEFTVERGRSAVAGLLRAAGGRPTAICAADDLLAFGVLEGARLHGLRVPADVAVTGFDDIPYASFVHPALTTVRQPIAALSTTAVELLARLLGGDRAAEQVLLEPELVVRSSTGAPAAPTARPPAGTASPRPRVATGGTA
jgi:LacI family transcriptional regulator